MQRETCFHQVADTYCKIVPLLRSEGLVPARYISASAPTADRSHGGGDGACRSPHPNRPDGLHPAADRKAASIRTHCLRKVAFFSRSLPPCGPAPGLTDGRSVPCPARPVPVLRADVLQRRRAQVTCGREHLPEILLPPVGERKRSRLVAAPAVVGAAEDPDRSSRALRDVSGQGRAAVAQQHEAAAAGVYHGLSSRCLLGNTFAAKRLFPF